MMPVARDAQPCMHGAAIAAASTDEAQIIVPLGSDRDGVGPQPVHPRGDHMLAARNFERYPAAAPDLGDPLAVDLDHDRAQHPTIGPVAKN